jgi:hypothetical protein
MKTENATIAKLENAARGLAESVLTGEAEQERLSKALVEVRLFEADRQEEIRREKEAEIGREAEHLSRRNAIQWLPVS